MKRFLCYFASLLTAIFFMHSVAVGAATQSQSIAVTPSSVDLALAPGESATKALTVVNQGSDAFVLDMSAAPYSVRGEDYDPQYTSLPGALDPSKWVTFISPTAQVRVEPTKLREVTYTVSIPASAKPGGYVLALFATTTPDPVPASVVAHNRVAIMQYITVKGTVEQGGHASAQPYSFISWDGTVTMPYRVKNTGEGYFIAKVSAVVKTLWGSEVARISEERYVLPQTQRRMVLDWQAQTAFGIYRVEQSADYLGRTERLPTQWLLVIHPIVLLGLALLIVGGVMLVAFRTKSRGLTRLKH